MNLIKSLSTAFIGGLLVFSFQNCGKAGFDSNPEESAEDLSSVSADTAAPFAYNATFDQITYNSCFGTGLSTNPAFFTLKAGAYDGGGVNLTTDFMSYVKSVLKPAYPATMVTVEQMKSYVGETAENANATLQMALRTQGAPQQIRNPTGLNPVLNLDYVNLMTDLTDDRIMEPIFRGQGTVANYFPLAVNHSQRIMEGSITYNSDEGVAYSLRNDMINSGMLALTYTGPAGTASYSARVPSAKVNDSSVAYGRGYKFGFAAVIAPMTKMLYPNVNPAPHSKNPNNILETIQESDLSNPSVTTAATWSCIPNRRYLIVKSADAGICPPDPVARMNDATYRRELEIIRRHLPASQWDVSVDRKCVIPKSGSCYNNAGGTAEEAVEYDQTKECYQAILGLANKDITKRCAQYVSICLRN